MDQVQGGHLVLRLPLPCQGDIHSPPDFLYIIWTVTPTGVSITEIYDLCIRGCTMRTWRRKYIAPSSQIPSEVHTPPPPPPCSTSYDPFWLIVPVLRFLTQYMQWSKTTRPWRHAPGTWSRPWFKGGFWPKQYSLYVALGKEYLKSEKNMLSLTTLTRSVRYRGVSSGGMTFLPITNVYQVDHLKFLTSEEW